MAPDTLKESGRLEEVAPNLAPPPGNPRFPLFDALRAIAALSVFLGHTITGVLSLNSHRTLFLIGVQLAYQGVAIFFLISGFLLYRPILVARCEQRTYDVWRYARRRVLRIVPAYWVALTVLLILGWISGVGTGNWWIFYGFGQIYGFSTLPHGIGVAWTLCIEVTFYAALPLFALAAARLAPRPGAVRVDVLLLVALAVASLVFRVEFQGDIVKLSTLPASFSWFALGMGLAMASLAMPAVPPRWMAKSGTLCWVGAVAASILLYVLLRSAQTTATALAGYVLYGVVALLVLLPGVFAQANNQVPQRVLRNSLLGWIGLISYSFYLYHATVIEEITKHITHEYLLVLLSAAALSIACAAASYYLVERPFMRLGRRHSGVRRGGPILHRSANVSLRDDRLGGSDARANAEPGQPLGDREGAGLE
jgi:peptidoglycan/LPS O-acetylase OafA/YrhL